MFHIFAVYKFNVIENMTFFTTDDTANEGYQQLLLKYYKETHIIFVRWNECVVKLICAWIAQVHRWFPFQNVNQFSWSKIQLSLFINDFITISIWLLSKHIVCVCRADDCTVSAANKLNGSGRYAEIQ